MTGTPKLFFFPLLSFIAYLLPSGCSTHRERHKSPLLQDSSVYTSQDYSALHIDSTYIYSGVINNSALDSFSSQILDFYRRRNFQAAWYDENGFSTHAHTFFMRIKNYMAEVGDSTLLNGQLVFVGDSVELAQSGTFRSQQLKPMIDVLLTAVFFEYARREYYGTEKATHDLEWYIPRKKKDYLKLLNALISSDAEYKKYEPLSPFYIALKKELIRYRQLEQSGALPVVPQEVCSLKMGDSSPAVITLKRYLQLTGDYTEPDSTPVYSQALVKAMEAFQQRMGIPVNETPDSITLREMNTPISTRIRQIMINLERLRWAPDSLPDDYLMVNIPEFKLHVFEKGKPEWDMKIIVGEEAHMTSIFSNNLKHVVFRPYWKVPQSIIVNEMLPILKRDPGYLIRLNMEVLSNGVVVNPYAVNWRRYTKSVPYVIRQKPGRNNSLGLIMFLFPNPFDIYMHDTPAKSLFEAEKRTFSHGCIRLAEAEKLARYIFRNSEYVTDEKIDRWLTQGNATYISVQPPLPVFITYFTAWVGPEGKLHFRKDVYGLDAKLSNEIFAR